MDSENEIQPHSPQPSTHVNLQHSLDLLTLTPSITQGNTPPVGSLGASRLGANLDVSRATKKNNRRAPGTAPQRRLQLLKLSTRLYHRQLRVQIAFLTRENERLKEIEDLHLAAEAAGLKVRLNDP